MPLHIKHHTRSANTLIRDAQRARTMLRPSTKDELRSIIIDEIEHQGPNADLNFIDTSLITDMSFLFCDVNMPVIRNIKINKWDTSNVTDMEYMFVFCARFNCDLGDWDVSSVENMEHMFDFCCSLRSLPLWYKDEQIQSLSDMKKEQNKTPSLISTIAVWVGIAALIYAWFF